MVFSAELDDAIDSGLQMLNPLQLAAVEDCAGTAASRPNVKTVVDGPPGAGKTTVCAYGALEYLRANGEQVVILSYTHTSADRCLQSLREIGVTSDLVVRLMPRNRRPPSGVDGRYYLCFDSEGELTHEEQQRLRSAKILLTTTSSARRAFNVTRRPLLLFDEISQISMGDYLGVLGGAKRPGRDIDRLVLVGDPAQLPVVTSQGSLETNAASYLRAQVPGLRTHQLILQYRMHPTICAVVNKAREALGCFPLETAGVALDRSLNDEYGNPVTVEASPWSVPIVEPSCPVVAINTDSLPGAEVRVRTSSSISCSYQEEAEAAVGIGRLLKSAYGGLKPVLIAPYSVQSDIMQSACLDELDCFSVHKAQGQEYDCVIFSLTRKNDSRDVGFLAYMLSLAYVGLSRARCKLMVLFSHRTFVGSTFPQQIVDFLVNDPSVARIDATPRMMNWKP